ESLANSAWAHVPPDRSCASKSWLEGGRVCQKAGRLSRAVLACLAAPLRHTTGEGGRIWQTGGTVMRRMLPILLILGGVSLRPANAQKADDDLKATIAYVKKLQSEGGGFFAGERKPEIRQQPTLKATSAAVRALKYLGADVPNKEGCKKFVESCFDKASGGF